MKSIKELFAGRFGRMASDMADKESAAGIISASTGISISPDKVSFRSGCVSVTGTSQAERAAIFIKRNKLIEALVSALPHRNIRDIK